MSTVFKTQSALLKDLIERFSAISLGNKNVTTDIIGDGFEYLIKKFADATNKKAGEFYTPRSVVRLLVDILDPQAGETVSDPACGTGGILLGAVEHVRVKGGDPLSVINIIESKSITRVMFLLILR